MIALCIAFIAGAFTLWAVGTILLRIDGKRNSAPAYLSGNSTAAKLVMARKALGTIANRESLREARKIANVALEESK